NRLPRSLRVLSAMTTVFGSARPCNRAARFGVSPHHRLLLSRTRPNQIANHDNTCRNPDTGLQRSIRLEPGYRRDQLQPSPHRALGIVLMGFRKAEVDEDTVAHVFRDEPIEAAHNLRDAFLIR